MFQDKITEIWYLHDYHTYWMYDAYGEKVLNPAHTKILYQFKQGDAHAIEHYYNLMKDELINFRNTSDTIIIPIPSSKSGQVSSSLLTLSERLATYNNIRYLNNCLERTVDIPKLAQGGDRHKEVHFNSLRINNPQLVKNKVILLLDDVTTSGNSLLASKELFEKKDTSEVICLSLTKTVHD
ncbi:phosphoribosyltransferase [Clostridium sp. YIM B02505]|uniref:Phosphoribosyltransferase n=1 Tax=Clostridium yunnanense TaxID=2800325 RepID=A0ABS1EQ82_9CLOT|nr:phosphoribosyltransferase family protein [Clostridium yunnanense]MBK1811545.1 phosphoribosyltransferase [Clostridium yunnanense]